MNSLMAQGVRFVICGVIVSVVYISVTTIFAEVSHLRFQIALVIGWCSAVAVHFTLQRTFVWAHRGFALRFRHQLARYALVAGSQLGVTATTTTFLPSVLDLPAEVVYLGTAFSLTAINFLVFRNGVFHPQSAGAGAGAGAGGSNP